MRREINILGGHPETVALWLAFIKKHRYYGIGMKANVFEFGPLDTAQDLDAEAERISQLTSEDRDAIKLPTWGTRKLARKYDGEREKQVFEEPFKGQFGGMAPSSAARSSPAAPRRLGVLQSIKSVIPNVAEEGRGEKRERRPRKSGGSSGA